MSAKFNVSWSFNSGSEQHAETTSKTAAHQLVMALQQAGAHATWSRVSVSYRGPHDPTVLIERITPTQLATLEERLQKILNLLENRGEEGS